MIKIKLLLISFMMIINMASYSQTSCIDSTYFEVEIVHNDSTYLLTPQIIEFEESFYVIFTIEEAQKINNMYDMTTVLQDIITEYGIMDDINIDITNLCGKTIKTYKLKIDNLTNELNTRKQEVKVLNEYLDNLESEVINLEDQKELYKDEKDKWEERAKKLEREKKTIIVTSATILTIIIIIALI